VKLATFQIGGRAPRIRAVIAGAARSIHLQAMHEERYGRKFRVLRSLQHLIEGGDAALDLAASLASSYHVASDGAHAVADVRLLAPVPIPIQIRDCLCFELHLKQAYQKAREIRAAQSADPDAAMRELGLRVVST